MKKKHRCLECGAAATIPTKEFGGWFCVPCAQKVRKCLDCGSPAVLFLARELGGWLCHDCMTTRTHTPENMALMQKDEFEESGGKLS
jgi:hypothetical protein